jgi:hypothetical protein
MAAPNLRNITTITAKTFQALLTTTLTTDLLTNSAASGKVFKVETIIVANADTANASNLTLGIIKSGGSVIPLANAVPISSATTVIFLEGGPIYLEEGDLIEGGASSASDLNITISYLELS